MRIAVLVSLFPLVALAAARDGGVELEGRWEFPERNAVVRFERTDAGWRGVIEKSARAGEVGFELFRNLRSDEQGALRGSLTMPEDGSTHDARVTVQGDHLRAVVGAWIFSKTLHFKRAP